MRMNGISNHTEYADSLRATNILMLREKIISTDELIRNYNAERETNEKLLDETNKLQKNVKHLNKECMKYENQLSESLRELQPCKESIKQLQEENAKYLQQISELENKLVAGEKLAQQYEALLKSREEQKDKNYVEKDEVDKQVGKKEKEIKIMKERIAKINEKLHDRISRSQQLVKCYKTSVKHLLKFGKKLSKQENASKVDQRIMDHYRNVISKEKNSNEQDDNELDVAEFCEETYADSSDSSFGVVEESIISSPYKRTPTKASLNEVFFPPPLIHKQISNNVDEIIPTEPFSELNSNPLQAGVQCIAVEETENVEVPSGMPVINESDMYPEITEKIVVDNVISEKITSDITAEKIVVDNTSYNELEEELARITYDMCSQGMPLSPLPPTPPPNQANNGNLAKFDEREGIAYNANRSPRKKRRQLDFSNDVQKNSAFDGAMEHTNGTQKLRHQNSEGFEVLCDDMNHSTPNGNGQNSQSSQHQNKSNKANNSTGNQFNNTPPYVGQNPEPLQQPFQANILHCPVDGNFKINIRMGKFPNETEDHKITSLNLEVNNITREFNISCSRISCELKNGIAETTCSCPHNLMQHISNAHEVTETSNRPNGFVHTDKSCNLFTRKPPSRDKTNPVTLSPSKSMHLPAETCHFIKHSERHEKTNADGFRLMPSSIMDAAASHQEPTCNYCSPHKVANFSKSRHQHSPPINDMGNNSFHPKELESLNRHKFQTDRKADVGSNILHPKQLQSSSDRQKVQNILCIEHPQLPFMDKSKPSSVKQIKNLPPIKSSVPQNICVKETRPLNKQKSITFVKQTQVGLSPNNEKSENTQGSSTERSNCQKIVRNNTLEIFPVYHKPTNNKRLLNDDDNENSTGDCKTELASKQTMRLPKKCRLDLKTNDAPVEHDSLVDHFWKLGRNIHDVKSSIPRTMAEIQRVKPDSEVSLRNLQSKLANPHHILSTDAFVQSVLQFLLNTKRNVFINFSQFTPYPLMAEFETKLIAVVQFLEAKGYKHLKNLIFGLKIALSGSIFSRSKQNSLFGTAALCRVYVALCRQCGELEQARLLCYDIFCNLSDSALFLVTAAIVVWPDILTVQQSVEPNMLNQRDFLQNVYIYLLLNGNHSLNETLFNQCMTVLKKVLNLSSSFNDIITLGKQVVTSLEDDPADVYNCPGMKCKLSEASMAIELLAMQARLLSQIKEFFDNLLMPTFTKWQNQFKQQEEKYEILLAFWLKVFGVAGQHCFQKEKYCLDSTMSLLSELLVTSEIPITVQESAFISLLTLQSLSKQSYLQNISDWLFQHEQNLSEEGKAFIEKINLKLVLEALPEKEQSRCE